jgi:hypothetical protein
MGRPDPAIVPMLADENVPAGGPRKRFRAEDLEGHRWMFMERGH